MSGKMTGDQIVEAARLMLQEDATPAEAIWSATGGTLEPGPDGETDPATITITVRLKAREAEFLRMIEAEPAGLSIFVQRSIANLRKETLAQIRAEKTRKSPGDGRKPQTVPRDMLEHMTQ